MSEQQVPAQELTTQVALKEWAIAIEALHQGETIMLLRKGGIRERAFVLPESSQSQSPLLLFPTHEHQDPAALKTPWRERLAAGAVPQTVTLTTWAKVHQVWPVQTLTEAAIAPLDPFHIWTPAWRAQRQQWRPERPLLLLLLRVYRLPIPQPWPLRPADRGCRSWLSLDPPISLAGSTPVLSEVAFGKQTEAIALHLEAANLRPLRL